MNSVEMIAEQELAAGKLSVPELFKGALRRDSEFSIRSVSGRVNDARANE
jgi:hypothetical protein